VLPPLALAPYSTVDFSLDAVTGQLPLPRPFCSIGIQYSGAPGSVIGEVSSIEAKGDLVVDSRVANEGNGWAGSGGNPWHLDEETESIQFLTNLGEREVRIGYVVSAAGVNYYLTELKLKPHETRAIDIRKLRDAQQADFKKNKIPADATDGSVLWNRIEHVPVMGQLVVLQRHRGMASPYTCWMCDCGLSYLELEVTPWSANLLPNQTTQFTATGLYLNCNGCILPYNMTNYADWGSGNESVATVTVTVPKGVVRAWTGGTANIGASYTDQAIDDSWYPDYSCHYYPRYGCGSGTVYVKDLASFATTVTSTPVTGETNSLVSGQGGQVKVEAIDNFGAVFSAYRGTVHFTSGDTAATLPANYTYTAGDNGAHTFSATLKTVSGTSATRDFSVEDTVKGKKTTQNINLWFNVIASREGLVGGTTFCGHVIEANDHFVALPASGLCGRGVRLAYGANRRNEIVSDRGPWCPHSSPTPGNPCVCGEDPYWQTSGIPYAQNAQCSSNHAGIDLADGTFYDLGLTGNAYIYWRFQ
jgi:hypothetical protein